MENNYIVYMHISPSNKRYIGITSQNVKKRWNNGNGYRKNTHFWRAINKYGWDNFKHIIIAKGLSKEEAEWLEIELIREWNSTNQDKGYNIGTGGLTGNGFKGEKNAMYGKSCTDFMTNEEIEQWKKNLSIANKGDKNSFYGKHHTEETKEKISKAKKGTPSHMKGKHHTEETKEKMKQNHADFTGENHPKATKIICITTMKIFNTIKEGAEYYKIKGSGNIVQCCKGKYKSAGKLENGIKLVWMYYEDYLRTNGEIDDEI